MKLSATTLIFSISLTSLATKGHAINAWDWAPSVAFLSNLDEANGWGFCPDITGFEDSFGCDLLQVHPCKEVGTDTQWEYDPTTKTLSPYNYKTGWCSDDATRACLAAASLTESSTVVLSACDQSDEQTFTLTADDYLQVGGGSNLCLGAGDDQRSSGGLYVRDFILRDCSTTDPIYLQYEIKDADGNLLTGVDTSTFSPPPTPTPDENASNMETPPNEQNNGDRPPPPDGENGSPPPPPGDGESPPQNGDGDVTPHAGNETNVLESASSSTNIYLSSAVAVLGMVFSFLS
ncbi:expressed unknown protein [Seminavis robusta]|uniref:Ricin B lectin domain-containing protein n=1 Tax=Seminavis robusta TaxID=568900 RepID=A0A9N8HT91_9STRA|nr:expressed unknown protein [Seminavis robusta]|eukprot:Sro1251_g256180.1 n/a (291) ;mRNA; f:22555-23427